MFACGGTDLKLFTINGQSLNKISVYNEQLSPNSKLTKISWSCDNQCVCLMQENESPQIICMKDYESPVFLNTIDLLKDVTALSFQHISQRNLALGNRDGEVFVFDLMAPERCGINYRLCHSIEDLQFNYNDQQLGVLCDEFLVIFFENRDLNFSELKHPAKCTAIKFHPTILNFIVVGCENGQAVLWDTTTSAQVSTFAYHKAQLTNAVLSSQGRTLISSGLDRKINIVDIYTNESSTISNPHPVTALDLSPDDRLITAGTDDGHIYVYDIRNVLKPLNFIKIQNNSVNKIAFERGDRLEAEEFPEMSNAYSVSTCSMDFDTIYPKPQDSELFGRHPALNEQKTDNPTVEKLKLDLFKTVTKCMNNLEKQFVRSFRKDERLINNEFEAVHADFQENWTLIRDGNLTQYLQSIKSSGTKTTSLKSAQKISFN